MMMSCGCPSALKEAHPHDIIMTRDAPNYMQEN